MVSTHRRVVVTGLGATTPLGGDVASTWSAMLAGRSGVRRLPQEFIDVLPVHIGAPVAVDPLDVLDRVQARRLDRTAQLALIAAREAWADAGLPAPDADDAVDPDRLGVVVGTGIGGVLTTLANYDTLKEKGARRVSPLAVPMLMPNSPAAAIALGLVARAGVHTPISACASGAEAIGQGLEMIRSGRADVVVCGGTEAAIHPLPGIRMRSLTCSFFEPSEISCDATTRPLCTTSILPNGQKLSAVACTSSVPPVGGISIVSHPWRGFRTGPWPQPPWMAESSSGMHRRAHASPNWSALAVPFGHSLCYQIMFWLWVRTMA